MGSALARLRAPPPAFPPPPLSTAARAGAAPPAASSSVPPPAAMNEMEQNRQLSEMLSKATITTTDQESVKPDASIPAVHAAQMFRGTAGPLKSEQLHELLTLHASDSEKWTVRALAERYSIDDHEAVASTLKYCEAIKWTKGKDGVSRPEGYRGPEEIRSPGFGRW